HRGDPEPAGVGERPDQPDPLHVRVVVLRGRAAGAPPRWEQTLTQIELDGPDRDVGAGGELRDPHRAPLGRRGGQGGGTGGAGWRPASSDPTFGAARDAGTWSRTLGS